jgi:tetrahydromethanopterin S-methyltransferase subunit G
MESYSKTEIDLKYENIEQRIEHKLDRVLSEVANGFKLIDKDISWLKWLTGGTFFLLISIVVAAAIRFLF